MTSQLQNMSKNKKAGAASPKLKETKKEKPKETPKELPKEIGGPKGPKPPRYGDWEENGRCSDF